MAHPERSFGPRSSAQRWSLSSKKKFALSLTDPIIVTTLSAVQVCIEVFLRTTTKYRDRIFARFACRGRGDVIF